MNQNVTIDSLNDSISKLTKEVQELKASVTKETKLIKLHPFVFVILLILFFVTMDFWTIAIEGAITALHPSGAFRYWELFIIATVCLLILMWATYYSGVSLQMIGA